MQNDTVTISGFQFDRQTVNAVRPIDGPRTAVVLWDTSAVRRIVLFDTVVDETGFEAIVSSVLP